MFKVKTSTAMDRQQIRKGASVVSNLQLSRQAIVVQLKQDIRYYSLHGGCKRDRWFSKAMYKNRYQRDARRLINPTKRNLIEAIKNLAYRLATEECPHYLPCGADDHWYEVRDSWKLLLKRLISAYKFLCYQERVDKRKKLLLG